MKKRHYERTIQVAFFLTALLFIAAKCTAQDLRLSTSLGLVIATESDAPDEICLAFGLASGEIRAANLSRAGRDLVQRVSAAAQMANDAAVPYGIFLKENSVQDTPTGRAYFQKCQSIRRQFLAIMPERALVEIVHTTQYLSR